MPDVTIREAANVLGVSPDTIRRRIRSGTLPATKGPRVADPYVVHLLDDDAGAHRTADEGHDAGTGTSGITVTFIDTLREQIAFKDRQIADLHRLLDQAHRLLPMAPETSTDDRPIRYAPAVPWWRRVFGG